MMLKGGKYLAVAREEWHEGKRETVRKKEKKKDKDQKMEKKKKKTHGLPSSLGLAKQMRL